MRNKDFKIINGDTIVELKKMEDKSIDMIFADPPYNMQTEGILKRTDGSNFKGVDDAWDKFDSLEEYKEFSTKWLKECKRILKDDGTMWVIGSFQNIYLLGNIIQDLDFWILNDIIWEKTNPVPNFSGARFCNAHETLIWFKKNNVNKFTFNYHTMKKLNNGKQDRSVWEIPICTGSERLVGEDGKKLHNTQKPLELLEKVVLSSTKRGDIILDPFSGTATTGAAALKYKRKYIGIEREILYCNASIDRLNNQKQSEDLVLINNILDIKPPRVAITELLEKNYINVGDILCDKNGENKVAIDSDGLLQIGNEKLSIHKASAKILNKQNHNGWDFWYLEKNRKSIDELRKKYREKELNFKEYSI